jgi:hypothetical protein
MTTAWEQAYLALRRCLADGTYPPGAHLREEDLATQLGVSRTPIRDALRRLDAEGWLRVVPNQGAFAAEWSLLEMVEIFDLRGMLEAHAAEHAAMAPNPHGIAALRAACQAGEAAMPGADLAAMAGFCAQSAVRRTPLLLDGLVVTAAALVADRLAPGARSWWRAGHRSPEPAHTLALAELGLEPIVDLGLRLGEGTGAAVALPILRAAVSLLSSMATFTDAGVSQRLGPDPS